MNNTYLDNKYTRWYYGIINRVLESPHNADTYTEKHHIIPRSMGGSDSPANLVRLSAREHFICHLLLTKMCIGLNKRSMAFAAWQMTHINGRPRHRSTSRIYSYLRKNLSDNYKGVPKKTSWWKGKHHTKKTLAKQSEAKKGSKNPMFGRIPSQEWIEDIRLKQLGRPKPKYTCSMCGQQVGGKSNLLRWHEGNCKSSK